MTGAVVGDTESGEEHTVTAKAVFNATGIFTDALRQLDQPATPPLLTVSRGTHIVVAASVLGGAAGIMVPKTRDGRVIFAIPWGGRVVIGTTDLPAPAPSMEPGHAPGEIEFLLETINPYLARTIAPEDVLSIFSGLRPLVIGDEATTARLSREHHIDVSATGLITVAGGKWTTYRRMAEDALNLAGNTTLLEKRPCATLRLPLHGHTTDPGTADPHLSEYGSDVPELQDLVASEPALAERIDAELPYTFAEVLYGVRCEMARTLDDVLSRRTRSLLLHERAAVRSAPRVAALIGRELQWNEARTRSQVDQFTMLAEANYSLGKMS